MKTPWKYHKINAIMFISLKNKAQNGLGIDFWWFYMVFEGLKTVLKILPIDHTYTHRNHRNAIISIINCR